MRIPPAAEFVTIFEKYRIDARAKRLEGGRTSSLMK
jgi:hypothetical protein